MKSTLRRIDEHLRTRMRIVIWKQWKTSARRYWGLRKLGAPEWIARKSVAFGNHYQAVAKTTGLRYISKEILARRGLLSCLDYYLNWTAVCRTARTVVWEGLELSPYSILRLIRYCTFADFVKNERKTFADFVKNERKTFADFVNSGIISFRRCASSALEI